MKENIGVGQCESGGCLEADPYETIDGFVVRIRSTISGTVCQATVAEFVAFRDRIKAGDFDHIGQDAQVTP